MVKQTTSIARLGLMAGLLTAASLILFFFLMKMLHLVHITELRSLNFLILAAGIVLCFRYVGRNLKLKLNYLEGFGMACLVSTVSVTLFAIFIFLYFGLIDPGMMELLKTNSPMLGPNISPFTAAASIIVEGTCSGLLIAFSYVQYYYNRFKP